MFSGYAHLVCVGHLFLIWLGFAPEKQNYFIPHIQLRIFIDSARGIRNSVSHKHNGGLKICRGRIEYGKVIGADQSGRRVGCELGVQYGACPIAVLRTVVDCIQILPGRWSLKVAEPELGERSPCKSRNRP